MQPGFNEDVFPVEQTQMDDQVNRLSRQFVNFEPVDKIAHLEIQISGSKGNLELVDYNPAYDSDYLETLRKKASGWLGEINPDEWLNDIRGGYDA